MRKLIDKMRILIYNKSKYEQTHICGVARRELITQTGEYAGKTCER